MKSIYVGTTSKKKKNYFRYFWPLILLVFFISALVVSSPVLIRHFVNKAGADEKGHTYRVGDIRLDLSKGIFHIEEFKVFHQSSVNPILIINNADIKVLWPELLSGNKIYNIRSEIVNIFISNHLIQELKRLKNQSKSSAGGKDYLDEVVFSADRFYFREVDDETIRTVLTLTDLKSTINDIGLGKVFENTHFRLKANVAEGGSLEMKGKTQKEGDHLVWILEGNLQDIPSRAFDKLAGNEGPMAIAETKVNAHLEARSEDGLIIGELSSRIQDFKFSESKRQGLINRGLSRVTNMLLKEQLAEDGSLQLNIPFVLKENVEVKIPELLKEL